MRDNPFSYAIFRLVPRLDRGEQINVGVIVFCRVLGFLGAQTELDFERASALWPALELESVGARLQAIERIAAGAEEGVRSLASSRPSGSTGSLPRRARSSSHPTCTRASATVPLLS